MTVPPTVRNASASSMQSPPERGATKVIMARSYHKPGYRRMRSGWLRGSNFVKPRRSTPLQDTDPTSSFGGLGRLAGSDAGVWLERDPDTVREPDLAFISSQKLPLNVRNPGYYEVVPDLVVEVASPSDSRREVNDKAQMWLRNGVRLTWVVHPDTRTIDVHPEDGSVSTLTENDTLDGGEVLPGFTCPVSEIFDL